MEQEEFLKGFGLITHESLKSQSETKRVERRRRTTANPKYNTNGFVDLSQIVSLTNFPVILISLQWQVVEDFNVCSMWFCSHGGQDA